MSDDRKHSAGKGDKRRPYDISKYCKNYDSIIWNSKKKIKKDEKKT